MNIAVQMTMLITLESNYVSTFIYIHCLT